MSKTILQTLVNIISYDDKHSKYEDSIRFSLINNYLNKKQNQIQIDEYKEFANWSVKYILLKSAKNYLLKNGRENEVGHKDITGRANDIVLYDIASGRGNDLNRWIDLGLKKVIGLEYSSSQMAEAINRYKKNRNKHKINVSYIQGSATDYNAIRSAIKFKKVDLITNNFAMNYFFGSKEDACNFLKAVSDSLNKGSLFIGTATDGDVIKMIFDLKNEVEPNTNEINTDLYHIKKLWSRESRESRESGQESGQEQEFGQAYEFKINTPYFEDSSESGTFNPFKEYIIHKDTLVKYAKLYSLELCKIEEHVGPIHNLYERPITISQINGKPYNRPYEIASLYFAFSFIKV